MPQWPPPPQVIFVLVLMALVLLAGIAYGLLSFARFLAFRRAGVSPFEEDDGGDVMSESANRAAEQRFRAGFEQPVLARPFQSEPEPVREKSWAEIGATLQNDEALIDLLSTIKTVDGQYRFSANKIRDIVGGADAVVKNRVATHRPKPAPAKPSPRLVRDPVKGWN